MNSRTIPSEWLPNYNYSDYSKWPGDWELIYGFPYAMSPSPKRPHQNLGRNFIILISKALQAFKTECDYNVYYKLDWIINDNTIIRPDAMIVCGEFEDDFLRFPPTLILEITSEGTRLKDRNVKFKLYESHGVKYYILADPDRKSIESFVLKNNQYQEMNEDNFHLTGICKVQLDLQRLWL